MGLAGGVWVERVKISDARAAREDGRQERQDDLQHATLIEFQEAFGVYVRSVGKAMFHDKQTLKSIGKRTLLPTDDSDEAFEVSRRLRQLAFRLRDDRVRDLYGQWRDMAARYELGLADPNDSDEIGALMAAQNAVEDRLGEVLRPLL